MGKYPQEWQRFSFAALQMDKAKALPLLFI